MYTNLTPVVESHKTDNKYSSYVDLSAIIAMLHDDDDVYRIVFSSGVAVKVEASVYEQIRQMLEQKIKDQKAAIGGEE